MATSSSINQRWTSGDGAATATKNPRQSPTSARGGFGLGRIGGVEIRVDWSLLIIFALVTVQLGGGVFPRWHPDWGPLLVWTLALGSAVLFFGSVLAHELSHAWVARIQGIPVKRITLFLFGGLAHMEKQPGSPKAEFLMAAVGPAASLAIGVSATFLGSWLAGGALPAKALENPEEAFRAVGPVPTLLLWLGPINVVLAVFNMVPGFPLDGGRVLRSLLWAITGNLKKATRLASGAGQLFAWTLMAFGVLNMFSGALGQGLWLILIGWFLNNAARMSYEQLVIQQALKDVPVSRVMQTRIDRVTPEITLDDFVQHHLMRSDQRAFPVERGGTLVGLVCFSDLRKTPQHRWMQTQIGDVMTAASELLTLPPDAGAEHALEQLVTRDVDQIPIVDQNNVVGLVRRSDLIKWLALASD